MQNSRRARISLWGSGVLLALAISTPGWTAEPDSAPGATAPPGATTLRPAVPNLPLATAAPAIVVPLAFFVAVVFVTRAAFNYQLGRERLRQETIRSALEKDIPIPPELLVPPKTRRSALRTGIILIGAGVGLILFFLGVGEPEAWGLGALPTAIGAAYLVIYRAEREPKNEDETKPDLQV